MIGCWSVSLIAQTLLLAARPTNANWINNIFKGIRAVIAIELKITATTTEGSHNLKNPRVAVYDTCTIDYLRSTCGYC